MIGRSDLTFNLVSRRHADRSRCVWPSLTGCGGEASSADTSSSRTSALAAPEKDLDRVVSIDGKRGLYVRCTGSGSPTVVMEGGDEDTGDSYAFAQPSISEVARTCVYDRANLGRSDPVDGPRGLTELVGDFEALLQAAKIPGPYVLVGTSGGGYISADAFEHPDEVAGMVFVEVPAPFRESASGDRGGDRPEPPFERRAP